VVRIGKRALRSPQAWVVAALAFVGIFALGVPFPLIVAFAAVAGVLSARWWPGSFSLKDAHGASGTAEGAADLGAAAAHTRPSRGQLLVQGALGLLLWAAPLVALLLWQGRDGVHTRMGWFFTKAALVTFGGAYAVLPYVAQVAIEEYRWVTATQMIDGLALGETTPGPLIMVVAFVAYVGAWQAGGGPWGGALGLLVATWFTFLPSFLFILLGAPLVERTHGNVRLTAALNGITAAVVGVILNLGVFFGLHVLWRDGRLDLFATGVTVAALVAQWRFGLGVIPVVLASGVLGLLHRLLLGG